MLRPLRVARARYSVDEDAVLAEAVTNVQTASDPMTTDERVVYDGDDYLGSVMMDGHLLTFCNKGLERMNGIDEALQILGATRERELLERALLLWHENECIDFSVASASLRTTFDTFDDDFLAATSDAGSLHARIVQYTREHRDAFIVLE